MKEMAETPPHLKKDIWEHWWWVWSAIFYLSLLISTVVALLDKELSPGRVPLILALVLLSALWHGWGAIYWPIRHPNFRQQVWVTVGYMVGAIGLWYGLVNLNSAFYLLLFGLYGQLYWLLPLLPAIGGSFSLTLLLIYLQIQDPSGDERQFKIIVTILVLTGLGGVILSAWISAIIRQSSRRGQLLEQLAATQADLLAAERKAGVLAERQRLAQEIHDTLAQGFTSVVMHLEAAENNLPAGATMAHHHLNQARTVARDSLGEARQMVWALRPEKLEQDALPEVIRRVVREWAERVEVPAGVTITGQPIPLHPNLEVTLLRATQEGLANIAKHAQASQVTVTLSYMDDVVMLDVQDNGRGFDPAGTSPQTVESGFGLPAMSKRVRQLGGRLEIESTLGEGTTLVMTIPL